MTYTAPDVTWRRRVKVGSVFENNRTQAVRLPAEFPADAGALRGALHFVGLPRDDLGVRQLAPAFEQDTGVGKRRPPLAA